MKNVDLICWNFLFYDSKFQKVVEGFDENKGGLGGLVWYGCLILASCFLDNGQDLFEFAEVFEYGYAPLCDGKDYPAFAYGAFFDQPLFEEKVQVFFENATVDVGFVHDVCQLQWASMGQNLQDVYVHFEFTASHVCPFALCFS